jgi:hypothetical protein
MPKSSKLDLGDKPGHDEKENRAAREGGFFIS